MTPPEVIPVTARRFPHVLLAAALMVLGGAIWIGPLFRESRAPAGPASAGLGADGGSRASELAPARLAPARIALPPDPDSKEVLDGGLALARSPLTAESAESAGADSSAHRPRVRGRITDDAGLPLAAALVLASDGVLAPEDEASAATRVEVHTAPDGTFDRRRRVCAPPLQHASRLRRGA
jgi:hypothetical protein